MPCCCSNGGTIIAGLLGAAGAVGLIIAGGAAQPDKPTTANIPTPPTAPAAQPEDPAMDPGMQAWMASAMPGEHHARLNALEGDWNVDMWWEMEPGVKEASKGDMVNRWVLGGRWIEMRMASEFMGQPFQGLGYMGYDNIAQKYISTWMDNTSTMLLLDKGEAKADGSALVMVGAFTDPMGVNYKTKNVWTFKSEDSHTLDFWHQAQGEEMRHVGGITFTRK